MWACTKTGTDAVLWTRCASTSTNNPVSCYATECGPDQTACCRTAKPLCSWNLTAPATSGDYYTGYPPGQIYCNAPAAPCEGSPQDFRVGLYLYELNTCPAAGALDVLTINIRRPLPSPNRVYTLPHTDVSLNYSVTGTNTVCARWSGSLTWHSDTPSWRVTLDATCTENGLPPHRLVGTLSGDI